MSRKPARPKTGRDAAKRSVTAPKLSAPKGSVKDAGEDRERIEIHTVGHSTLALDVFAERLATVAVGGLADVRRFPASRRHPQFEREAMSAGLAEHGIAYRWFEALGGRRSSPRGTESPNAGLRVGGFRAYADYALTEAFAEALDELVGWGREQPVAICCAEGLWWQCHRRIVSDHLVARGHRVIHLLPNKGASEHVLWELARVVGEGVIYPPPQAEMFEPAK